MKTLITTDMLRMRKKICLFFACIIILAVKAQDYEAYTKIYNKVYHKTAWTNFDKALQVADSLYKTSVIPAYKVRSLLLSAQLYQQRNDIEKAISYAESAENIIEKTDDYAWQARVSGFLASQYRLLNLYNKSRFYSQKTLETARKINNPKDANKVTGLMLQELARLDLQLNHYKEAILKLDLAQKNFNKLGSGNFFTAANHELIGQCFVSMEEYTKAIDHYKYALAFTNKNMPESILAGMVYKGMTLAYMRKGELDQAKIYLDKAEEYVAKSEYIGLDKEIYQASQEYYAKIKDVKNFVRATEKKDSLAEKIATRNTRFINEKYSDLEKQNVEEKQKGHTKSILIGVSVVFILGNLSFFIAYQKKQKQQISKVKKLLNRLNKEMKLKNNNEHQGNTDALLMPAETEEILVSKLKTFEQEIRFTDKNMSLSYMATTMDTNTKNLSYIIKKYRKKDFTTYTNELRIHYIVKKLTEEPVYRQYKIRVLAEEAGFSSHSKFATTFKNITGASPSDFVKDITGREEA
ncbi:helix-turn-helix domain-containing protein [Elizabethkingia meningoseptica]|uniref:helix-turn-helix domain-containing protein n=1 Tax=Elizabethkingia meningoseptica TaxID=238 RepID=UPI0023B1642D|nr:helix-turn-helix domain-containing protein [Elizabethkingia meningoseptica]